MKRISHQSILLILLIFSAFCGVSYASPLTDAMRSSIEVKLENALERKDDGDIFSVFAEGATPTKTLSWNNQAWTRDLDLTGVAWWNSADGYYRRATLITPRHLIIATHYSLSVGNEVAFLQKDNTIVYRKITAKKTLPLPANLPDDVLKSVDIDILELGEDVPAGVNYYPLFDSQNLSSRIDDTFPVISFNQDNRPSILPITYSGEYDMSTIRNTYKGKLSTNGVYLDFTQTKSPFSDFRQAELRKGDSSNPIFALLGNQLVLFSHQSRTASSTNFAWFVNAIDAELADMGSGYRVTVADVSKFRTVNDNIVSSLRLDSAPEQEPEKQTTVASSSKTCKLTSEYAACQSRFNTFAGAKKTLTCLGILPEKYVGYSSDMVKRSTTLDMALKMRGEESIKPTKDIKIYQDVKKDLSLIALTQTGIKYGLLSETNNYFKPNRNTTRAEAYHMFLQSVCLPMPKTHTEWEKNLYDVAYQYKFTTQTWDSFEADRYMTNGELLIIAKRVLEYKYTYGGCGAEVKSCDIR